MLSIFTSSKPEEEETSGPMSESALVSSANPALPASMEDVLNLTTSAPPFAVLRDSDVSKENVFPGSTSPKRPSALLLASMPKRKGATVISSKGAKLLSSCNLPVASTQKPRNTSITPAHVMPAPIENATLTSSTLLLATQPQEYAIRTKTASTDCAPLSLMTPFSRTTRAATTTRTASLRSTVLVTNAWTKETSITCWSQSVRRRASF
jgi:hypothetical protein